MAPDRIEHIIGIDGGGSGCRVAITERNGNTLGKGKSGPANATSDMEATIRHIREALELAADEAGLADPVLAKARAHAGIAGALTRDQFDEIAKALPMPTKVTEDKVTALKGALGDRDGILLAIGTGSLIGAARKGKQRFMGGYGLILSDQASGAWLGRGLLTETLLCHDGLTPPSDLTRKTLESFDDDANAIVAFAATASPRDFATLAPKVLKAAGDGDPVALTLVQAGSIYLTNAIDTLGLGRNEVLCLAGGVGPSYADWLMPNHKSRLAPAEGTPLDGALALAREAAS